MTIHGLERWRQRFAADREALERRRQDGQRQAQRAADALSTRWPGVRQVWLFGSLLSPGFHGDSDLDLIVAGLPPEAWIQAVDLAEQPGPLVVDLKRAEDLEPELRQRLLRGARPLLDARRPHDAA
jgi:predicted nucleotidyltransferase